MDIIIIIIIIIISIIIIIIITIGIWRMQRQGQLSCGRIISGSDISTREHDMKRKDDDDDDDVKMTIEDWQLAGRKV